MKVGIFGGYAKSIVNFRGPLIRAMVDRNHSVTAFAPEDDPDVRGRLAQWGVSYHTVPLHRNGLNPLQDFRALLHIRRLFAKTRPHILLNYTMKPAIYGSLAARSLGIPSVSMITGLGVSFASDSSSRQRILRFILVTLLKLGLRQNKVVFFQNGENLAAFTEHGIVNSGRTVLLGGTGVDLNYYLYREPKPGNAVFVLPARLIREKGIAVYAKAAQHLKRIYPQASFRLLGFFEEGPNAITRKEIASWVREGAIAYLGYVNDVRPYIRDCTAVVLPSYYPEGIPRSLQEALALGRPVITTNTPGCKETVIEGQNGYLIPPKDVNALVKAMEVFIQNPEKVCQFGRKSRELAEARFDVLNVNAQILKEMGL